MKIIARLVFKIHRLVYKYPCKSEVRLGLDNHFQFGGLTYFVGMLYICSESLDDIANSLFLNKEEVKYHLNKIAKDANL